MLPVLLRASSWRGVLALSAAAALLGAGAAAEGASGLGMKLVQMSVVLVGGAAACALDEPAAAVVQACPTRLSRHLLVRAGIAVVPLLVGVAAVLAWWSRAVVDRMLLLELGGCWVLGFALATVARRRLDEPAEVVAAGLVLTLLTVLLVDQVGQRLVLFPSGEQLDRATRTWALLMAGCGVGLVAAVRERRWKH
jgi:hypothetical protein